MSDLQQLLTHLNRLVDTQEFVTLTLQNVNLPAHKITGQIKSVQMGIVTFSSYPTPIRLADIQELDLHVPGEDLDPLTKGRILQSFAPKT